MEPMLARLVMIVSVTTLVFGAGACSDGDTDCNASLLIRQIDGVDVALQDQGASGRDGCDFGGESVTGPDPVLTFDCRILYPAEYTGHRPTPPDEDNCGQ